MRRPLRRHVLRSTPCRHPENRRDSRRTNALFVWILFGAFTRSRIAVFLGNLFKLLEDDMSISPQSRTLVACMGATLLGGVSALVMLAGNVVTVADAGTAIADRPPSLSEPDFPICHTPTAGRAPMLLRLAQTEVPRAEMSAASSTPAF